MATQRSTVSKTASIHRKAVELAMSTPQVVAHRLVRLAVAGRSLSPRDQNEFTGMVKEKQLAFGQAWVAMAAETVRVNQIFAMQLMHLVGSPMQWGSPATSLSMAKRAGSAALGILGKGLAPVHRKAVSNAKRLAGTSLL